MCSITGESLDRLFCGIYRDIDSQLVLPRINPIHGLGTIIIVVHLIALHGIKFHLRGLIHLESLFLGILFSGIDDHVQIAGVLREPDIHSRLLLHEPGFIVENVAAGHGDYTAVLSAVLRHLHAVDEAGRIVDKVNDLAADPCQAILSGGSQGGGSILCAVGLVRHGLIVTRLTRQPAVRRHGFILRCRTQRHRLQAIFFAGIQGTGNVIVDVSRLAVYDLVSVIVLFIVIPQAAIGIDELPNSLILPGILPIPGLGDAGYRTVFLHTAR